MQPLRYPLTACLAFGFASLILVGCTPQEPAGQVLVYEIDRASLSHDDPIDMDKLVAVTNRRLDKAGRATQIGSSQIRVEFRETLTPDELLEIERRIGALGRVEFRITANRQDHDQLISIALDDSDIDVIADARVKARWVEVDSNTFPDELGPFITRQNRLGNRELLVIIDDHNVRGDLLMSTRGTTDDSGHPCVDYTFGSEGTRRLASLTTDYKPTDDGFMRHLAIIVDDTALTAPTLNEPILEGRGRIHAGLSRDDVQFVVNMIHTGSLPCPLRRSTEDGTLR